MWNMVLKKNKANFWLRCGRCGSPYSSTSCTIAHMFCTFLSHTTNNCQSIMDHLFINDTFANLPFVFARLHSSCTTKAAAGVLRYQFMTIKHKLLTFLLALNWNCCPLVYMVSTVSCWDVKSDVASWARWRHDFYFGSRTMKTAFLWCVAPT